MPLPLSLPTRIVLSLVISSIAACDGTLSASGDGAAGDGSTADGGVVSMEDGGVAGDAEMPDGGGGLADAGLFGEPLEHVTAISVGATHVCALDDAGGVWCWGSNQAGQLGDGTATSRAFAAPVVALTDPVVAISAGGFHTCALLETGKFTCWGTNASGQLGLSSPADRAEPVAPRGADIAIAAGYDATCRVRESDGRVLCAGKNDFGQLGDGTTNDANAFHGMMGPARASVVDIAITHACYVRMGEVYCAGLNARGQLGTGDRLNHTTPTLVVGLADAAEVSLGEVHGCALRTGGTVACWGWNRVGQVGQPTAGVIMAPMDVPGLSGVTAVGGSGEHVCAVASGRAMCWGRNDVGQLGDGTTDMANAPVAVVGLGDTLDIDANRETTCAVRVDGTVACWGRNQRGQLGDGTTTDSPAPVTVRRAE